MRRIRNPMRLPVRAREVFMVIIPAHPETQIPAAATAAIAAAAFFAGHSGLIQAPHTESVAGAKITVPPSFSEVPPPEQIVERLKLSEAAAFAPEASDENGIVLMGRAAPEDGVPHETQDPRAQVEMTSYNRGYAGFELKEKLESDQKPSTVFTFFASRGKVVLACILTTRSTSKSFVEKCKGIAMTMSIGSALGEPLELAALARAKARVGTGLRHFLADRRQTWAALVKSPGNAGLAKAFAKLSSAAGTAASHVASSPYDPFLAPARTFIARRLRWLERSYAKLATLASRGSAGPYPQERSRALLLERQLQQVAKNWSHPGH